jgi:hypothetical protein
MKHVHIIIFKNAVFWDVMLYGSEERWFLQEPHDVTSQKTAFFLAIAMKTSNLKKLFLYNL